MMTTTIGMWVGFIIFLIIALSIDTFLQNKKQTRVTKRVALYWTLVWISCALIFNLILWLYLRRTTTIEFADKAALEFLTGYLIEKSLSVDNLFVFYLIFNQFKIPAAYQHRIFTYGIWGAVVFRLVFILLGAWLVTRFHWILYLMGLFLLFTGVKMLLLPEKEKDLYSGKLYKWIKKYFHVTTEITSHRFFVKSGVFYHATPLLVALVFIEFSDIVFALDSIPAIFAITTDPFIVWTSNIFAILGLRALYFILADMVESFHLLKYGVAFILVFVGIKMLIEPWFVVPTLFSLGVISATLVLFSFASWMHKDKHAAR